MQDDLRAKMREGLNTIAAIITKYAPSSENDTGAYIAAVSRDLHKSAGAALTEADIQALARAITIHEDARVKTAASAGGGTAAGNTTSVQIDAIHVTSPSADPRAVADQVGGAIQRKVTVSQSDTGQS